MSGTKHPVIQKLEKYAPILALCYEQKGKLGVLLATKVKDNTARFVPMSFIHTSEIFEEEEREALGFVICGIGNYGEFSELAELFQKIAENRFNICKFHKNFHEKVIRAFAGYLNYTSRSKRLEPFAVEFLLICSLPEGAKIYRITYDGNYHPVTPYGVIGGQKEQEGSSDRKKILAKLRNMYAKSAKTKQPSVKNYPPLKTVIALATKALEKYEGEIQEYHLKFF